MVYGYHRTSTAEQHLDRGIASIESFCREHGSLESVFFTMTEAGKEGEVYETESGFSE